jgi:hypothetical protein
VANAMDDVTLDSDGTKFHWTLTGTDTGPGGMGNVFESVAANLEDRQPRAAASSR